MELYRSGHNGAHSKCVCPPGHEGSNPSNSAQNPVHEMVYRVLFVSRMVYSCFVLAFSSAPCGLLKTT